MFDQKHAFMRASCQSLLPAKIGQGKPCPTCDHIFMVNDPISRSKPDIRVIKSLTHFRALTKCIRTFDHDIMISDLEEAQIILQLLGKVIQITC